MTSLSEKATGTSNEYYNLISVLFHMLEGASNYAQYAKDAEQAGDPELAKFFNAVKEQSADCAHQAEKMLADRIKK